MEINHAGFLMEHERYVRIDALVSLFKNPRAVLQSIEANSAYREELKERFPNGFGREYGHDALFGIEFCLNEDTPDELAKVSYVNVTT